MTQPDNIIKSFKVDLKTEIPYYLIILPAIFFLGVITKPTAFSLWPIVQMLTVLLVCYSAIMFRLTSIEIDPEKGQIILTEKNLLKKLRTKSYPLKDLQFTYKIGKPGLRHRKVNVCRLYMKEKEIAAIIPDFDGWTDYTVNNLVIGLIKLGVTKKFIGYSLKDAEINGL